MSVDEPPRPGGQPPRQGLGHLWPWAVMLPGSLGLGVWAALSPMVSLVHADTLIPVLASLLRWQPFCWEQDRWGMLLPALAMPITHPLMNLLTQIAASTAAALLLVPLLHQLLLGRCVVTSCGDDQVDIRRGAGEALLWSWLVGAGLLLAVASGGYQMDLLFTQPYAAGLAVGLAGLLAMGREPRRSWRLSILTLVLGGALLFLSLWVNLAGVVLLGPLLLWRQVSDGISRRWQHPWNSAQWAAMGGAYAGADALRGLAEHRSDYGWLPVGDWPAATATLLGHTAEAASPATGPTLLGLVILGLGVHALWPVPLPLVRRILVQAAGLLIVAGGYLVCVSANQHVSANGLAYRYALPAFVLLLAAAALISGLALRGRHLAIRWLLMLTLAGGVVAGMHHRYGGPSYANAHRLVDQKLGSFTDELLAHDATLVMGQYWDVWHAVFHANLTLHERGEGRRVYGIAHRGNALRPLWWPLDAEDRIAVRRTPKSLAEVEALSRQFDLPPLHQTAATEHWQFYSPVVTGGAEDRAAEGLPDLHSSFSYTR